MIQNAKYGFSSAVIENIIYIVGEKVEVIRPLENISEIRGSTPSEASQGGSGYSSFGGKLYMFGGRTNYYNFFSYEPD